jgi:HD-like signal output (HDOD) protein
VTQASEWLVAGDVHYGWLRLDDLAIPMLPDYAVRVMQVTNDPDVTVPRLAALVSKDPVLAMRVLSLANSAMYGALTPLRSVQDAVVRLGVVTVRNIVMATSLQAMVATRDVYGTDAAGFVEHAVGTAYLARLVAGARRADEEEAFLSGLVHDIGKLVILKTAHAHKRRGGSVIHSEEVATAVAHHHAACGAIALHFWNVPDEVLDAVRHHHNYPLAADPSLAATCYLANRMSHRYGCGCEPEGEGLEYDPVLSVLGLDAAWLQETDARASGLVATAQQLFT